MSRKLRTPLALVALLAGADDLLERVTTTETVLGFDGVVPAETGRGGPNSRGR